MNQLMYVQMSGAPGAGKSTLAKAIAPRIAAVILDHDVTKSALLEAGVPSHLAGAASYTVLKAMAKHLLQQGHSVIFDSPCFYDELLASGVQLAQESRANYRYIECRVTDLAELDRRLRSRSRLPSQVAGVYQKAFGEKVEPGSEVFSDWVWNMKRPAVDYLVLDTTQPLATCVDAALFYIQTGRSCSLEETDR